MVTSTILIFISVFLCECRIVQVGGVDTKIVIADVSD